MTDQTTVRTEGQEKRVIHGVDLGCPMNLDPYLHVLGTVEGNGNTWRNLKQTLGEHANPIQLVIHLENL